MFIGVTWALAFASALIVSLITIPVLIYAAQKMSLLDSPDNSLRKEFGRTAGKLHHTPIPRIGGVGMILSFFLSLFIRGDTSHFLPVYGGSAVLFGLGFLDDIKPLPALLRLLIQVMVCTSLVILCNLDLESLNLMQQHYHIGPLLGGFISVFILVGAMNSVNMIDGLDGLAGGLVLVGITMLCYLHFLSTGQTWSLGFFGLGLMGAIIGFLKYNAPPAKIFMGDGGSTWLGFYCGFMLIVTLGGFRINQNFEFFPSSLSPVPLSSGLLCLAIPILDTAAVIMNRMRLGNSPFKADSTHFHHILIQLGFSQKKIVMTLYFLSLVFGTIAVFPVSYSHSLLAWAPPMTLMSTLAMVILMKQPSSKVRHLFLIWPALKFKRLLNPHQSKHLLKQWATANRYIIYSIICMSPLLSRNFGPSLGHAASMMGLILLVSLCFETRKDDFSHALLLVFGLSVLLVAINDAPVYLQVKAYRINLQHIYNGCFYLLALSVGLFFIASLRISSFNTNTTDFLLITIPLCLLIVPEPYQTAYKLSLISARALVLFFALRTFVFGYKNVFRRLKILATLFLFYIAAHSLLSFQVLY